MGSSTASAAAQPVFVVTGPSGAGKGTLIERVLPRFPELAVAVSATTRARRPGERDGAEYYFLSHAEFDRRVAAGELLEWVEYIGNRYGTLVSEVERLQRAGKAPILELETEGALWVKRNLDGAVTIFVTAPLEELKRRLRERATESSGEIGGRIETARRQLAQQGEFDYVVENDDRDQAAERLAAIIEEKLAAATMASR